jgi:hypothetical protein
MDGGPAAGETDAGITTSGVKDAAAGKFAQTVARCQAALAAAEESVQRAEAALTTAEERLARSGRIHEVS